MPKKLPAHMIHKGALVIHGQGGRRRSRCGAPEVRGSCRLSLWLRRLEHTQQVRVAGWWRTLPVTSSCMSA